MPLQRVLAFSFAQGVGPDRLRWGGTMSGVKVEAASDGADPGAIAAYVPAPTVVCGDFSGAWAAWSADWDAAKVNTAILDIFPLIVREFGGPMQFLESQMPTKCERLKWATQLLVELPKRGDLTYVDVNCPNNWATHKSFNVHLCDLNFLPECSSKPPPGRRVFGRLLDEYLTRSVLTEGRLHEHLSACAV